MSKKQSISLETNQFDDSLVGNLLEYDEDKKVVQDDEKDQKSLIVGEIVTATVLDIVEPHVYCDIGSKLEAILPYHEVSSMGVKIDSELPVYIESLSGGGVDNSYAVVSYQKADKIKNWETAIQNLKEGQIVSGKVIRKVKGGLIIDVGLEAFVPASQVDVKSVINLDSYIGKELEGCVVKVDYQRRNIVISGRELQETRNKEKKTEILKDLRVGDSIKGVVKRNSDFGSFIDIGGGVDGLIHITDLSWRRVSHPSEVIQEGQEVEAILLSIDIENQRISLGLKQKNRDPWLDIEKNLPVGSAVKGKVVGLKSYGAFVDVEGVECLLHISQMSWDKHFEHPSEYLHEGQEVDCFVLSVNAAERRVSLSMKHSKDDPWLDISSRVRVGDKVEGEVRSIKNYGAFIRLCKGIDGLLHISDLSWTKRYNHPSEILKIGQKLEVMVLSLDVEGKKVAVGLKQLSPDPWEEAEDTLKVGQKVQAKVQRSSRYGIFVVFGEDQFEGLVPKNVIQNSTRDMKKSFNTGDELELFIKSIDIKNHKIALDVDPVISEGEEDYSQYITSSDSDDE